MAENEFLWKNILLFSIFTMIVIFREGKTDKSCMEDADWKGNSYFEYGNSISLSCPISDKNTINVNLNKSLPMPHFTLLNDLGVVNTQVNTIGKLSESSIRLHIEKPPKSKSTFTCTIESDPNPICSNTIIVDSRPSPVNDFNCISYNFENLTCTWTPINSFSEINYTLAYCIRTKNGCIDYECGSYANGSEGKMSCTWSAFTYPEYRQYHFGIFYFELIMENVFGSIVVQKNVSHYALVLPNPPDDLEIINKTTESIYLSWSVPADMKLHILRLEHRIMYRSNYELNWQVAGYRYSKGSKNQEPMYINLTNLYAYTAYDITVSLRSVATDENDDAMWSKNSSITVTTIAKAPATPPFTNIGSFEIESSLSGNTFVAYIYWKQIKREIRNGGNFSYYIEASEETKAIVPQYATHSYVKIDKLNEYHNHTFYIWSKNSVGKSETKAIIYIPEFSKRIEKPIRFTKTDYDNGYYELFWEKPNAVIKNYTLFWCAHTEEPPYQCEGFLDWLEVPGDQTSYNVSLYVPPGEITQFAISANSESSSSGMVWACPIYYGKTIPKPQDVEINPVSSTSVKVIWRYKCSDGIATIKRVIVYYCSIPDKKNSTCTEPKISLDIDGDINTTLSREIFGLKQHTTYKMSISVVNRYDIESLNSDYQIVTTKEDAPFPPTNLVAKNVTNSSILVVWEKPEVTNGILRIYKIRYTMISTNFTKDYLSRSVKYNLTNLKSHVDYDITVLACTIKCSKPSEVLRVRTLGGYPSEVIQLKISFRNSTDSIVEWKPPIDLNENSTYQLMIENSGKRQLINVTDTEYTIKDCGPDGDYSTVSISIRVVNIYEEIFYGPWSEKLELSCGEASGNWLWTLTPLIFLFVAILVYKVRRMYYCCREMQKVEITLPPGIEFMADTELPNQSGRKSQDEKSRSVDGQLYEMVKLLDKRNSRENVNECSSRTLRTPNNNNNNKQIGSSSENSLKKKSVALVERNNLVLGKDMDSSICVSGDVSPTTSHYCVLGIDDVPIKNINPNYVSADVIRKELQKRENELSHSNSKYVSADIFQQKAVENESDLLLTNRNYVSAGIFPQKLEDKESDSPSANSNYVCSEIFQHKSPEKENNRPATNSNYVSAEVFQQKTGKTDSDSSPTDPNYVSAGISPQKLKDKESDSPSANSNYVCSEIFQHKSPEKENNRPATNSNYVSAEVFQQKTGKTDSDSPPTDPNYVSAGISSQKLKDKESDSPSVNSNYVSAEIFQQKSLEKENNLPATNSNYISAAAFQQKVGETESDLSANNSNYVSAGTFTANLKDTDSDLPSNNSNSVSAETFQHKSLEKEDNLPATNSNYVSADSVKQRFSKDKCDIIQNSNSTPCYVQAGDLNRIVNSD